MPLISITNYISWYKVLKCISISDILPKTIVPVTQPWLSIFPSYVMYRYSFVSYIASYQYLPATTKYDVCGLGVSVFFSLQVSDPVSIGYTIHALRLNIRHFIAPV